MKFTKGIFSLVLVLVVLFSVIQPAFAAGTEQFFPRYTGSGGLVDGLKAIGADSSYAYREKIAEANGVKGYAGSAQQNTYLLSLLCAGALKVPVAQVSNEAVSTSDYYFRKCASHYESITEALASIGVNSSFSYRKRIASVNGMPAYAGRSEENVEMLRKLKAGTLVNPDPKMDNVPINPVNYFDATEIFGHRGEVYICAKAGSPVRSRPTKNGETLYKLEKGEPVQVIAMVQNKAGNRWIQMFIPGGNGQIGYIYLGNMENKIHRHDYVDLTDYGYEGYKVCTGCATVINTEPAEITMDDIHLILALLSMEQSIGNAFDVADGLLCLVEGDVVGAGISFAAAFPWVGSKVDALQLGKATTEAIQATIRNVDVSAAITKVGDNTIKIVSKANTKVLARNMENAFMLTGDFRFFKWSDQVEMAKRSFAAHHIVAGNATDAAVARKILENVGIDINAAENGVYMCMKSDVCGGTIHAGGHSKAYYEAVNEALTTAYESCNSLKDKREAVIAALNDLATRLRTGDLSL